MTAVSGAHGDKKAVEMADVDVSHHSGSDSIAAASGSAARGENAGRSDDGAMRHPPLVEQMHASSGKAHAADEDGSGGSRTLPTPPAGSGPPAVAPSREGDFFVPTPAGKLRCPMLVGDTSGNELPIVSAQYLLECHMATMFVRAELAFSNAMAQPATFLLPMQRNAVVTSVTIVAGETVYESIVMPNDELSRLTNNAGSSAGSAQRFNMPPNVFSLPVRNVPTGAQCRVTINYIEEMLFHDGQYSAVLPLDFWPLRGPGVDLRTIISVACTINAGTSECTWGSATHPMIVRSFTEQRVDLVLDPDPATVMPAGDFEINYRVTTNEILATVVVEPPPVLPFIDVHSDNNAASGASPLAPPDSRSSFAIMLTPPRFDAVTLTFPRVLVFLLDRSGSMSGRPFAAAVAGVQAALRGVGEHDLFNVIAFDHEQLVWQHRPVSGTADNKWACEMFLRNLLPRGGTNIITPLSDAIDMAQDCFGYTGHIFLVTDGAVANERDIVRRLRNLETRVRISTFGIGPYCNSFFLRMLAQVGRGFNDHALDAAYIYAQMAQMMNKSRVPLLTDIQIGVGHLDGIEVHPYPIPDLYFGHPLIVSGKFHGNMPPTVRLIGRLPDGSMYKSEVPVQADHAIPVHKVFARQRLDLLVAECWLEQDAAKQQMAVALSVDESIPCYYTTMVLYETSADEKLREEQARARRRNRGVAFFAASAVVGFMVFAGVGAGSIGATLANSPVAMAMGIGGTGGEAGCCACCADDCGGDCDCAGGDCAGACC